MTKTLLSDEGATREGKLSVAALMILAVVPFLRAWRKGVNFLAAVWGQAGLPFLGI